MEVTAQIGPGLAFLLLVSGTEGARPGGGGVSQNSTTPQPLVGRTGWFSD